MKNWNVKLLDPNDSSKVLMKTEEPIEAQYPYDAKAKFYSIYFPSTAKPPISKILPYIRVSVIEDRRRRQAVPTEEFFDSLRGA